MAGNAFNCGGIVAGRISKQIQTKPGFWIFLFSNVLWIVWGWHAGAIALIILQVLLAAINIRGVQKNDPGV
jgi:hypothetical protein